MTYIHIYIVQALLTHLSQRRIYASVNWDSIGSVDGLRLFGTLGTNCIDIFTNTQNVSFMKNVPGEGDKLMHAVDISRMEHTFHEIYTDVRS